MLRQRADECVEKEWKTIGRIKSLRTKLSDHSFVPFNGDQNI